MELKPLQPRVLRLAPAPAPLGQTIRKIALVGNFLPRHCGIATYTTDIYTAFRTTFPDIKIDVWAMNDDQSYDYPPPVVGTIEENDPDSYRRAARAITANGADMVWVQHEFGIFGDHAGQNVLRLIERLAMPVAVAMHTVLAHPTPDQRRVTLELVRRCETLIVMAERARTLLVEVYGAAPGQVIVIPHGVPDRPLRPTEPFKQRLGLAGREVIMTFGLLSPGKGLETMIEAMPAIAARRPQALYLVVGATHPHCVARDGECYRDALARRADELGVADHVRFIDTFLDTPELLDHLAAADIYATPYLDPEQVTSGTLAYAAGLGKAIVSTPYVHARELLADGHGVLVDFGDAAGFAQAIVGLLGDPAGTEALRRRAYDRARGMIWARLAENSLARFEAVAQAAQRSPAHLLRVAIPQTIGDRAIAQMSDGTGMLQHARYTVPDRRHGYCIDDNARALMLACRTPGAARERIKTYAAFIDHAWNPDEGCFRNFMGYDRRWLESRGSDDSNGRTVWALGTAVRHGPDADLRDWARALLDESLPRLDRIASIRACAFMGLGLIAAGRPDPALLSGWCDRLLAALAEYGSGDWHWFEPVLAYDNARLCEVLIRAGQHLGRADYRQAGLATLQWLAARQVTPEGLFRAVGTDSFFATRQSPLPFDQQPVEAWAAVDAYGAAGAATGDGLWAKRAVAAYQWFLGRNELGQVMADPDSGLCRDGLEPKGVNRNCGAESILAFHLATLGVQACR